MSVESRPPKRRNSDVNNNAFVHDNSRLCTRPYRQYDARDVRPLTVVEGSRTRTVERLRRIPEFLVFECGEWRRELRSQGTVVDFFHRI